MHGLSYTRSKLRKIEAKLRSIYGRPDLGNLPEPEDEIFFIILTRQTHEPNFSRPWSKIKNKYPTWEELYQVPPSKLAREIKKGGLSKQKADSIISIVRSLVDQFGRVTVEPLSKLPDGPLEEELLKLKGLNIKSVRCVMMYSMGRQVFPVDTHCHRILDRLIGLPESWSLDKRATHDEIQKLVPEEIRYSLHVCLVCFGRDVCKAINPRCSQCSLRRSCSFYRGGGHVQ